MASPSSNFNMQQINTKELADITAATIQFGGNVFSCARRGSGKSAIGKSCIRNSGFSSLYLNASTFERTDAGGFPKIMDVKEAEFIKFLLPYYYETLMKGNEKVVVFFDEIDKMDHSVIAPLLEFTQFHTINGRSLPNLQAVLMAGNLPNEGGSRPPLPLLDRAEKYLVEATTTQWLDWAAKEGKIHASITAYLHDHPDDLFGDTDPGDVYADPSPRGWHNYSEIVNFGEQHKWGHNLLTLKASGCVGRKAGIKYAAYFDHYQVLLPIVEKVMRGEDIKGFDDLEPSKRCVACMIVCSRLARILDENAEKNKNKKKDARELPRETETVARFLRKVDPELALVSIRSQIGLDRTVDMDLDRSPEFDAILRELSGRMNG
jgi:hypothetical protein